jgi:hypothetical protein
MNPSPLFDFRGSAPADLIFVKAGERKLTHWFSRNSGSPISIRVQNFAETHTQVLVADFDDLSESQHEFRGTLRGQQG